MAKVTLNWIKIISGLISILVLTLLCSCSSTVQIENGYCGVATKFGTLIAGRTGPSAIEKPFLGTVIKFQQSRIIDMRTGRGQSVKLVVRVIDPVRFYQFSLGNYDGLANRYESKFKDGAGKEVTTTLLKDLNRPETGILVGVIH